MDVRGITRTFEKGVKLCILLQLHLLVTGCKIRKAIEVLQNHQHTAGKPTQLTANINYSHSVDDLPVSPSDTNDIQKEAAAFVLIQ